MKSAFHSYLVLLSIVILVGCIPSKPTAMPTVGTLPSTFPELATYTPIPTSTLPATRTATVTLAITPEPLQAKETITALLHQPIDCPTSCFWGIVPGQTTISEAKNILISLGFQATDDRTFEYKLDQSLLIRAFLRVRIDSVVENLAISIVPEVPQAGASEYWSTYSPTSLMDAFGTPSRVDLALEWGPRPLFDMTMYFDNADLIVEYMGHNMIPKQKGSPRVCLLNNQYEIIRIWMGKNAINTPLAGIPLEKATSLELEDFSTLMKENPDQACFVVNGDVFP
jgi:hypothetical protein